jgi:uncharacterized protein YndB with AHSA1/START domain
MMPVKKDASGRRSVQAEVEVPGTPEQVWQAIATGPGISAWFVPSEVEEREGGTAVSHFGPGTSMDSVATITTWDPPKRFAFSSDELGPGASPVATEWTVEAQSGGTCRVRVVHSWFASTDDWDSQFEGHELGWAGFFRILRIYLTHFAGQPCAASQFMGFTTKPVPAAWNDLAGALGLAGGTAGQRVASAPDGPRIAGTVERAGTDEHPELLLRLDEPSPGIAHLFAMRMGPSTCVSVRFFMYGNGADAVASRVEPIWQTWLNSRFSYDGVAAQR